MRKNIFIFIGLFFNLIIYAQVGVNTTSPNILTEFDIQNIVNGTDTIPKGIMIPRITEKLRDKIDVTNSTLANGLFIYNIDQDCYNYYSKDRSEWTSLCGALGKAVFTIDCSSIEAKGKYLSDVDLTTTNFIKINVTVKQPGTYSITAVPNIDNGYYFSTSGSFLSAGSYSITIPGFGTPTNFTPTGEKGDQIIVQNNGVDVCDDLYINIEDSSIKPEFRLTCRGIIVNGSYVIGTALTSANTIQMVINGASTAIGSTFEIQTNELNGYSFSGSGTISGGDQTVTLVAKGTPTQNQTDVFTISTNSTVAGGTTCEATVKVAARKMKVLGAANNDASYNIGRADCLLNQVMRNSNYFGLNQQSGYPVNGFEFSQLNTGTRFAGVISSFNPDIIFVQYNVTSDMNDADITALTNFVNNGGALIVCSDGDAANATRNQTCQKLVRSIFDDTNMTVTGAEPNGTADTKYNTKTIQSTGTMITNGPFMNLAGLAMGRDGGNNFDFSINGFPYDKGTVIAFGSSDNDAIYGFMHKTKGFAFFGDGAPFAAAVGNVNPYNWPAKFSQSGGVTVAIPNVYSKPTSYNSFLFLNSMAWAIDYAQKNK